MKKFICSLLLVFLFSFICQAQTAGSSRTILVSFKIKNNHLLPAKITIISYQPDEKGNGTAGYFFGPYGSKTYRFPEGTKIYLANNDQVNTVMSGAKISDQPPFLIVKQADEGKIFSIK